MNLEPIIFIKIILWDRTIIVKPSKDNPIVETPVEESLVLECLSTAIPPPIIRWYFNENELMPDKRHHFEDNDQKLTIKKLSEKDTGLYTCVSENRAGFAEKFWKVEVYIQPTLIWHPEPLSSPLEGESISLECEAEGNPKARFLIGHQSGAFF